MSLTASCRSGIRQRGFVLLVVLWSVALLALIGTRLTGAGRTEAQIARNLLSAAMAEAAADGAIQEAVFRLLAPGDARWPADGLPRLVRVGAAVVEVRVVSESGKINPNRAPAAAIAALLHRLGMEESPAATLAAAIFDWRTPGQLASTGGTKAAQYRATGRAALPTGKPFESLGEIGAVLGMSPQLLDRLRPFLSVHNEAGIDPRYAAPAVRLALADIGVGLDQPGDDGLRAVTVTATAALSDGTRFARSSIVQLRAGDADRPWQVLSWTQAGAVP